MLIRKIEADGRAELVFLEELKRRGFDGGKAVDKTVSAIIDDVFENGDDAVKRYTLKFDGVSPSYYEVPPEIVKDAPLKADKRLILALRRAIDNITDFHGRQKEQGFTDFKADGVILGQLVRAVERVGLYIPGGSAPYLSSVLMCAVPAKIAGVKEIVMTTPPQKDGGADNNVLAAAALCGADRVFLAGGAQAVAALAYGTEAIPKADKIVGPGNVYVAAAKKLLYGVVDIDMIAGPSEILVIADKTAEPRFIAADMLSQAEHDALASAVLITDSGRVADETANELERQASSLPRRAVVDASLKN
jgi:histidinol dehydrogenase